MFRLTVVDTPGFGDGLEGSDAWQVVTHSSQKFNQFNKIPDKKLDFIEPLKIIKYLYASLYRYNHIMYKCIMHLNLKTL